MNGPFTNPSPPGLEVATSYTIGLERIYTVTALLCATSIGVFAIPLAIVHVGGGPDILLDHPLRERPIEGKFFSIIEADKALRSWVLSFVEGYSPHPR